MLQEEPVNNNSIKLLVRLRIWRLEGIQNDKNFASQIDGFQIAGNVKENRLILIQCPATALLVSIGQSLQWTSGKFARFHWRIAH